MALVNEGRQLVVRHCAHTDSRRGATEQRRLTDGRRLFVSCRTAGDGGGEGGVGQRAPPGRPGATSSLLLHRLALYIPLFTAGTKEQKNRGCTPIDRWPHSPRLPSGGCGQRRPIDGRWVRPSIGLLCAMPRSLWKCDKPPTEVLRKAAPLAVGDRQTRSSLHGTAVWDIYQSLLQLSCMRTWRNIPTDSLFCEDLSSRRKSTPYYKWLSG